MRSIGDFDNEQQAHLLSEYLFVKGIENDVEPSGDAWEVWVHDEDQLDLAAEHMARFRSDPNNEEISRVASKASDLRKKEEDENRKAARLYRGRDELFSRGVVAGMGGVTLFLLGASILVAIFSSLGSKGSVVGPLLISEYPTQAFLPEVRMGQVWRLLTPIFLHFGILHLVFNMLWLRDLGGMIEAVLGSRYLVLMVVIIGVASNAAQYFVSGPLFGGMSGIVYGLLGFVWMKGKFDPFSNLHLHSTTVTMMIVWFFICLFGLMGPVANTVHAVGLLMGMGWGYLSARMSNQS